MPRDENADWLGDLRWQGYPKLQPIPDRTETADADEVPAPPRGHRRVEPKRIEELARENEALRGKLEQAGRLAGEFEKRLASAAESYEGALLEADSSRRQAELERERLAGELASLKAELGRLSAREPARDAELQLERERRAAAERSAADASTQAKALDEQLTIARAKAAELAGTAAELRRQTDSAHEALVRAKALTDQDVRLLRQELREFLAKVHRIAEDFGDKGEAA